jgi:hypothetical protein
MLILSFYSTAEEVEIRLAEPASTIIIARNTGEVIKVFLKKGDYVTQQSVLLSIKNDESIIDVESTSEGIILQFGKSVQHGFNVDSGDFLVEIQDSQLKGILSIKKDSLDVKPFKTGLVYCCMKLDNLDLYIQINNQRITNDKTTYFFSTITKELLLHELIKKGNVRNMNVSFKRK